MSHESMLKHLGAQVISCVEGFFDAARGLPYRLHDDTVAIVLLGVLACTVITA